jgi:hypothetical protein
MTPAEKMEMKRLTRPMWALLGYAEKHPDDDALLWGSTTRTAKLLAGRGFVVIVGRGVQLTTAGQEALDKHRSQAAAM